MAKLLKTLLVRTASIAINTQLIISPMALAQDNTTKMNAWDKVANAAQAIGSVAQTGMQLINKNQSTMPLAQYRLELINPLQSHPAISANGCLVYEAKGDTPPTETMCSPKTASEKTAQMATQLLTTAKINMNDLENYQTNGNESQTSQGAACLNKAALDYQQKLKARLKELDNFEKLVEESISGFKEAMELTLKETKKRNALLNGKSNDEENSLADYDFGKEFGNQSCATFINQSEIGSVGDEGGFRALEKMMNEQFEGSSSDTDKYSPKQLLTNERQIKSDIEKVLENFNNNIAGTDSIELDSSTLYDGAQPKFLALDNENLSNVVENELKDFTRTLRDKKKQFKNIDPIILESIESGSESSSDMAEIYKRNQYNACLAGYISDSKSFAKSITNYSLTDAANKDRDSLLRTKVYENLEDDEISIDQKISNISKYDTSSQERIRLSSTQVLCGKTIYKDAKNVSVSALMSLYKCECEKVYNSKNGGTISASETEAQIAGYTQYIADEKSKLMSSIGNKVKEKVLFCTDDVTTGVGALSCTNAFDKSSNSFCLATAKKCAGQIGSCMKSVNQKLVQTRNEQLAYAATYNAGMNDLKKKLEVYLKANISKMEQTALYDDANNKTGSLVGTTLNLKMDQLKDKFIDGLDDSLQMEDPDAYLDIMKEDIRLARETLQKSNNELFGGDVEGFTQLASNTGATSGLLGKIASYLENAKAEQKRWEIVYEKCSASIDVINQQRQEQNKRNQEMYAKQQQQEAYNLKKCQILEHGCEESLFDFATNVTQVAGTINGSSTRNPYKELCGSNKSKDPDEVAAELVKGKDIFVQRIKIENYCNSGKAESEYLKKCQELFAKKKDAKDAKEIKTKSFCKGYEEKDLYADNKFCITYSLDDNGKKVMLDVKSIDTTCTEKIPAGNNTGGEALISYSQFEKYTGGEGERNSAIAEIEPACITPEDSDYKSLASAAYLYYANKSPEFSGYGESQAAQDCKTIIANSTGSGDKDEGILNFIGSITKGLTNGSNAVSY